MTDEKRQPPKAIFLQFYGEDFDPDDPDFDDIEPEITWCQDQINKSDICYVRKDIYDRAVAALELIVGENGRPDRYGYGAAANALDDEKRRIAREVLQETLGFFGG